MKRLLAIVGLLCFAPAMLAAEPAGHSVVLTWSAPASSPDPVTGYNVYRAEAGFRAFARLNASPITSTTYTDNNVQPGAAYTYYVVSVDAHGNQSAPSEYWSSPTLPGSSQHRDLHGRIKHLLLLLMIVGIAGLIAIGGYFAWTSRARPSSAR